MDNTRRYSEADRVMLRALIDAGGACAYAVCRVSEVDRAEMRRYARWIADGCHGDMGYLADHNDVRADPALLLDGARSMLICVFSYRHDEPVMPCPLRVAHYAQGADYHVVVRQQLARVGEALEEACGAHWRVCVDTAPLRERWWAQHAGLGFGGLNGTLIIPGIGSMTVLGTMLTDIDLTPTGGHIIAPGSGVNSELTELLTPITPEAIEEAASRCQSCGACLRRCPNGALRGDGSMDARRCINYLTIEYRGSFVPGGFDSRGHLFGCDDCLRACPHNRGIAADSIRHLTPNPFDLRNELATLTRDDVAAMTSGACKRLTRGSAMNRATPAMLRRNIGLQPPD